MAKKVISYKLNTDGTIPSYVLDGGHLPKDSNNTSNMVLMGISKNDVDISGAEAEFATEADAIAYVSTYLEDSTYTDALGNTITMVVADEVAKLFAKLG